MVGGAQQADATHVTAARKFLSWFGGRSPTGSSGVDRIERAGRSRTRSQRRRPFHKELGGPVRHEPRILGAQDGPI